MEKIYVVIHAMNETAQVYSFFEILSAHSTVEKAKAAVEKIREEAANGTSIFFANIDTVCYVYLGGRTGYTFKWQTDEGVTMYSHIYIKEVKLDEGE